MTTSAVETPATTATGGGRLALGFALAIASAVTFGTSGTFASSLIAAGWSPGAAVTLRISVAAAILAIPAVLQMRGKWHLLRRSWPMLILFGMLAVAGAQLFYFNALSHLSVGVALLLEYLGVLLVVLWMWLRHGQRPRTLTRIGAVVAVAGLVLVLDMTGDAKLDIVGVLWGLAAAVGLASYFVLSSKTDAALPPLVLAAGGLVVAAATLIIAASIGVLPFEAPRVDVQLLGSQVSWVVPILGLSLVAAVFAYVAGIAAARLLGATLASFIGLTEVLAAVLLAWLFLGQQPVLIQMIGGALIISGVVLVRVDDLRAARIARDGAGD